MKDKIKEILWEYSDESYDGDINQTAYIYSDNFTRIANDIVEKLNLDVVRDSILVDSNTVEMNDAFQYQYKCPSCDGRIIEDSEYCSNCGIKIHF